jgi:hypothetical protein
MRADKEVSMKLAILAAVMLVPSASAPPAQTPAAPSLDRMNVHETRAGCVPIPQQVAGTERRNGTRLDQQPDGRLLLAVDRQVDGCHEVTFVNAPRRR